MEIKADSVALDSLEKAKQYKLSQNFGRSFAHYLVYLELCPNDRPQHEAQFNEILCNWGLTLESRGQIEDLCKFYLQALNYFPSSVNILNNFGAHLLRLEQEDSAKSYLELAHSIDKKFLPAEKNLATVKMNLVPRWHFRMLNDFKRNSAYCKAIQNKISNKHNKIIDIGAGCGILSCYAGKCNNVSQILAIENSGTLVEILKDVLVENDINNVIVINKNSTDLTTSSVGLSNLLITEIFDAALFGEHVLETLIHAWNNLLEPKAKVIPCSADVFVVGINGNNVINKHKFCTKIPSLNLDDLCVIQVEDEPYEAENLKNKNILYITNVKMVITVKFDDVEQLQSLYSDENSISNFNLKVLKDGTVDAFAVWFNLHLDEHISISTSPFKSDVKCWEQALVYLDHPLTVQKDEEITLNLFCTNNQLKIRVLNPKTQCAKCFRVSSEMLSVMNDESLIRTLTKLADAFEDCNLDILDVSPFPLFGLLMAKNGSHVNCVVKTDEDMEFLRHVALTNDLKDRFKINFLSKLDQILSNCLYDVIYIDPISMNGTICESNVKDLASFRNSLKPDGLILPENVTLVFQIIESDYIDYVARVSDKNLSGLKVAKYMNKFAVSEQWMVDTTNLSFKALSSPINSTNIMEINTEPHVWSNNVSLADSGRANAILYWFNINFFKDIALETFSNTHYSAACFLLDEPLVVSRGECISVAIKQHSGLLKIYLS